MKSDLTIRRAEPDDAGQVGAIIRRTLRDSNAADYSGTVITPVMDNFSAYKIDAPMRRRTMFVAVVSQQIVGTGGLEQDRCRTLFVAPEMQNRGVGCRLIAHIEAVAREADLPTVFVSSSLTAVAFYQRLGFEEIGEELHGEEKTITMKKSLLS